MNERDKELANQVTWYADVTFTELSKFAAIIRADEREACAKVCEDAPEPDGHDLAQRIRARGKHMNREDVLKIVKESYEQGQSDLIESCKEAAVKAIEVAIAAEREACAQMVEDLNDIGHSYGLENRIRARGNT